jgi:endonuclease-3 related protein
MTPRGASDAVVPATGAAGLEKEAVFLAEVFRRLSARYDLDRWHWREDTPAFDICLGAILVQHTAWANVERALDNLRAAGVITPEAVLEAPEDDLARLLRPAGLPATKARRLKTFLSLAAQHGSLEALLALPAEDLRRVLLATHGIGPETADVIVLYASKQLVKVHDAYTQRLMRRLGLGPERDGYDVWARWLADRLPADVRHYQLYHAGIVVHCKETCRSVPKCAQCPLLDICGYGKVPATAGETSRP